MPVLLLTEDDVRQLLTMDMALEAVREVLRRMALDEAHNVPRSRVQTDHVMVHVMSGAAKTLGIWATRPTPPAARGPTFTSASTTARPGRCWP